MRLAVCFPQTISIIFLDCSMKYFKKICRGLLIAAFWICVWAFVSWKLDSPLLFPSPLSVLQTLGMLLKTPQFYLITANSLLNILSGLVIGIAIAVILSLLTFFVPFCKALFSPLMTIIKATPVASFIILALLFIGTAKVPTFITVLIVLPIVWANLDEGLSRIDPQLAELARVYRMPLSRKICVLYLPSLKPYFLSASKSALGLAWKAGIAAEIIAMPPNTIGTMISETKLYIMTPEMFAWTLTVILLSLLIEFALVALIERLGKKKSHERRLPDADA